MFRRLDQQFNNIIVVILASVTVLASLVAFLQSWADTHYAANIRRVQTLATEALGYDMRSRQQEGYDFSLYTTWNEWDWRQTRAADEAAARRAEQITALIQPLTSLLDPPYFDPETATSDLYAYHADINVVTTTLLMEERAFAIDLANAWNARSDGYITVLTLLAVALFLFGLSTTVKTRLRYLFALVGLFLVLLSIGWMALLTVQPIPEMPLEAIRYYARGRGFYETGRYDEAVQEFDAALAAYPDYGRAYAARAEIHLDHGEYTQAAQDYEQAIALGTADPGIYWNLGWSYHLAGDYGASLQASRKALALDPNLLPVQMNVATTLLVQGQTEAAMEAYEQGLRLAADPTTGTPPSWSHLYIRLTVEDLNNLIAALDGQHGFYQEPDLSHVQDPAALRQAAEAARLHLKEGLVAIEAVGRSEIADTQARIAPLRFGRNMGWQGELLGPGETFARGVNMVVVEVPYETLPQGAILSRRVSRVDWQGFVEYLPTLGQDITWSGGMQGTLQHQMESPWPGERGFLPGIYTVEYYVNGHLLQSGRFVIPDTDIPIIGPIVPAPDHSGGGRARGPAAVFPAGINQVEALFNYSGIPGEGATVSALWYRDDLFYDSSSLVLSGWGSDYFYLNDLPAGRYRVELYLGQDLKQTAEFQVVEVEEYLRAVGGERDDPLFQRVLGDAYAYQGDYRQAEAHFRRAVELDPECAVCYYRWWSALYDEGDYLAAAERLAQALALRPKFYTYWEDLGKTYYMAGEDDKAMEAFRQGIRLEPAWVYNGWGNALFALERYAESISRYQLAVELAPDEAVYHANLAGAYRESELYMQAAAEYAAAVALDPEYDWAYNGWGNTLYAQEDYAGAADKYRQAIAINPNVAVYHYNLGMAYYHLGQTDQAIPEFETAVDLAIQEGNENILQSAQDMLDQLR